MRLVCVGDSWTMGHGVEDDRKYQEIAFPKDGDEFIVKLRMLNGWPRWLANKYDCEFVVMGECGGNNEQIGNIIHGLIEANLLKSDDLIIVMFSYPYRDSVGPIQNFTRIENLLKPYRHFYFNSFYPTFLNEETVNTDLLPKYFINPTTSVSDVLKDYEIKNDVSVWEYGSRRVWKNEKNFWEGDYHPNLLGYRLIANHIYDCIEEYNNLHI